MNRQNLLVFLLAVSPLASYLLGRFSRVLGVLVFAGLFAGSALSIDLGAAGLIPVVALFAYALAALAHSLTVNSDPAGSGTGESLLREEKSRVAGLEAALRGMKADFTALGTSEKKALTLYSAVKLLSEAVDIAGAGRQFGKYIRDYFGTSDFAFYVSDLNSNVPELFASGEGNGFPSWEAAARLAGGDPARLTGVLISEAERTALVPVNHAGAVVGFFALRFTQDTFRKEALESSALEFAGEVSFAVKRIQLFKQVEWLSLVDGLTGVYRRNALDEKMEEEIKRAVAFRTTLGFMIVDIDHFKRVNDRYGHQFGDFVLKKVGALLRSSVYETDFVGRYGGEEFGIILPRADFAGVLRKAEAIRTRIEGESFSQGFDTIKVTVSIGIAHFPRDGAASGELIARADAALYKAKETGRNKVVDASQV